MTKTVKALIASAAIVVAIAGASGAAFAAKGGNSDNNTRPGWGYGDKNHVHTGPPGQSVRP